VLLKRYGVDMLELYTYSPRFISTISDRPVSTAFARAEAVRDHSVPNMRHEQLTLDDGLFPLARLLDGKCDRAALLTELSTLGTTDLDAQLRDLVHKALLIA
jgi:hypothetical protein